MKRELRGTAGAKRPARGRKPRARAGAAAGGSSPSITDPHNYNSCPVVRVLLKGIDSLYLSYPGGLSPEWEDTLGERKELAQSEDIAEKAKAQVKIGDHIFEVKDKGKGRYAFVLQDNAFHIQVSKGKSLPLAHVQISSEYLHHVGVEKAEKSLRFVVNTLGMVTGPATVSRADQFVDFVSAVPFDTWNHRAWVTRAHVIEPHYRHHQMTGWSIGKGGDMSCRLYDKLLEICTKSRAVYFFKLWQQAGWQLEDKVYRLEAQVRRPILKELGIETVPELLANLPGLWAYFTQDWLRLAIPSAQDENQSRWPNHPLWDALSSISWSLEDQPRLKRFRPVRIPPDDKLFLPGMGYLFSFMAREGIEDFGEGVGEYLTQARRFFDGPGRRNAKGFERQMKDRIALKGQRFNTVNNLQNDPRHKARIRAQAEAYRKAKDPGDEDA